MTKHKLIERLPCDYEASKYSFLMAVIALLFFLIGGLSSAYLINP